MKGYRVDGGFEGHGGIGKGRARESGRGKLVHALEGESNGKRRNGGRWKGLGTE